MLGTSDAAIFSVCLRSIQHSRMVVDLDTNTSGGGDNMHRLLTALDGMTLVLNLVNLPVHGATLSPEATQRRTAG